MLEDFRLKVFVAAALETSFTKAGARLGISQSAVTQNISGLEKTLGVPLFERTTTGKALTPQGELFMHYAQRILAGYEDIQAIFGTDTDTSSTARLYADRSASVHILPEVIKALQSARPGLRIEVTDKEESADIILTSTLYRKSGSFVLNFQAYPKEHPLASAIQSLIDRP